MKNVRHSNFYNYVPKYICKYCRCTYIENVAVPGPTLLLVCSDAPGANIGTYKQKAKNTYCAVHIWCF